MSDTTQKAVNHFLQALNDRRFSPEWFAQLVLMNGDDYVQDEFMQIIRAYLASVAHDYIMGVSKIKGTSRESATAYAMLQAYYDGIAGRLPLDPPIHLDR
jgi:hypothetical protein